MPEWLISLVSVIVGAVIGISGTELVQFLKRPRLEIVFEEREEQKPFIPDFNDETMAEAGRTYRIKYLRLQVSNKGKTPATDCEAKLEILPDGANKPTNKVALHWSRRDPALYVQPMEVNWGLSANADKIFLPINLNINDSETVDVFSLHYSFSTVPDTDLSPRFLSVIESASLRELQLQAETKYHCKVTIYSGNTNPKSFSFVTYWDGTLEGFNKAFTKS